ncbi:MAG: TraB/GumN family protein [Gammaproteobacteria bacterium]
MKRVVRILLILLGATAATAAYAATGAIPAATAAASASTSSVAVTSPVPARHFLWRVSRGRGSLYLVGSIHALNPDDYPLSAQMETEFRRSTALVEEINLTMVDPASVDQEALRMGAYPKGKSLRTELPPPVYQKVAAGAQKLGIDMARLDRLRPWLGSIAVLQMQLTQAGFRASDGVDHHFADEAQMAGKRVIGLETPHYQLELLARLPEKVQQDMLLQSLSEAQNFQAEMSALIAAWEKGDTASLEKIMQQDFKNYPLAYKLLIADRNRAWMPRLEHLLRSGRQYFVVVGALHMVGQDGLLARFEKAGYKVEQL